MIAGKITLLIVIDLLAPKDLETHK